MNRLIPLLYAAASLSLMLVATPALAQTPTSGPPLTWDQVKTRFEAANPALKADALGVDEMKAAEITANLRPNPNFTFATDGTQLTPNHGVWQPFSGTQYQTGLSYLYERERKRAPAA